MNQTSRTAARTTRQPQPTWEIAYLFPTQGNWSEEEYLALNAQQLVEFSHGFLEILPIPTTSHQLQLMYLYGLLLSFSTSHDLGTVLVAPLRVRLWRGKFREPDLVFMRKDHASRIGEEFWQGADLVMEVVSGEEEDRRRDLLTKRQEYARARIPEYWIIDPRDEQITVLRLVGKRYVIHGAFGRGTVATSHLLRGFSVNVTEALSKRIATASRSRRRPLE
jgi:Uma2 family endonuclease